MNLSNLSEAVKFVINNPYVPLDNLNGLIAGASSDNCIILALKARLKYDGELYIPKPEDNVFLKLNTRHIKVSLMDAIKALDTSSNTVETVDSDILYFVKCNLGRRFTLVGREAFVAGYDKESVVVGYYDSCIGFVNAIAPFPAYVFIKGSSYTFESISNIEDYLTNDSNDEIYDDSDMDIDEFKGENVLGYNILDRCLLVAGTKCDTGVLDEPLKLGDYIKNPESDLSNLKRIYL